MTTKIAARNLSLAEEAALHAEALRELEMPHAGDDPVGYFIRCFLDEGAHIAEIGAWAALTLPGNTRFVVSLRDAMRVILDE